MTTKPKTQTSKFKDPVFLETVAEILLEVYITRDERKTAEKYGLSDRTLRNYRQRLFADPVLARIFQEKKARVSEGWADEVPGAMRAAVGFIRKAAEDGDTKNPDMLHSVSGSLKILSGVAATWKLLDKRLREGDRNDEVGAPQPVRSNAEEPARPVAH